MTKLCGDGKKKKIKKILNVWIFIYLFFKDNVSPRDGTGY